MIASLMACTRLPTSAPSAPSFEERLSSNLVWQPGDAKASEREIVRMMSFAAEEATVLPLLLRTEIRNRCGRSVIFTVGPYDAVPSRDSPSNTLGAGEAIDVFLTETEWVHIQTASGVSLKANGSGGWIVITGDAVCDAIVGIHRR